MTLVRRGRVPCTNRKLWRGFRHCNLDCPPSRAVNQLLLRQLLSPLPDMAPKPSKAPVALKAQAEPHWPWSLTCVTAPLERQSTRWVKRCLTLFRGHRQILIIRRVFVLVSPDHDGHGGPLLARQLDLQGVLRVQMDNGAQGLGVERLANRIYGAPFSSRFTPVTSLWSTRSVKGP